MLELVQRVLDVGVLDAAVVTAGETHLLQIEAGAKCFAGAGQHDGAHVCGRGNREGQGARGHEDERGRSLGDHWTISMGDG